MQHLGRKIYHVAGGITLLAIYHSFERTTAFRTYLALFVAVFAAEIARLALPSVNRFLFDRFGSFVRQSERTRFTGTVPYIAGVALSFAFYRPDLATAAVSFLVLGDVAATTVGERFGRTRLGAKSLEGTLAFFAAAVAAGFLLSLAGVGLSHELVVAGALTAAVVELLPLPLNDNLTIPIVSGGAMELIARTTGYA